MTAFIYVILLIPAVLFLSIILKKYIFKSLSILAMPIIAFLILQFIPLPRSAVPHYTGSMLTSDSEPFAIGVGYPFAIGKFYLGEGCVSGEYPKCSSGFYMTDTVRLNRNEPTDSTIKYGDILLLYQGGILYSLLFGIPLLLISYLPTTFVLKKIEKQSNSSK